MREPKTFAALILASACAREPSPAPPPAAPVTVPVASASAAPPAVQPDEPRAPPLPFDLEYRDNLLDHPPPPSGVFDRASAAAALGGVDVQGCAVAGGPHGPGRVRLTFANNGSVRAAVLEQGPFTGTPVGECILTRYRNIYVSRFAGNEVTVGKAFTVK
jgi:hypothetical protein